MLPLLPGNGLKYGQRDEFIRCLTIHASCACQPSKKLTKRWSCKLWQKYCLFAWQQTKLMVYERSSFKQCNKSCQLSVPLHQHDWRKDTFIRSLKPVFLSVNCEKRCF